jgi:hypothetical protein
MTSSQQLWGAFTTTVAGEVSNGRGGHGCIMHWVHTSVFESYMLCEQMVDNSKVEFKGLCTRYNFVLDFFAYVAWSYSM